MGAWDVGSQWRNRLSSSKKEVALMMRRILLVLAAALVMAAMIAASAMPAFAAPNERSSEQSKVVDPLAHSGTLGAKSKRFCSHRGEATSTTCGEYSSGRGNYGDTKRP